MGEDRLIMSEDRRTNRRVQVSENIATPIGELCVIACSQGITSIDWTEDITLPVSFCEPDVVDPSEREQAREWLHAGLRELDEYVRGQRRSFDVPVVLHGTAFQIAVWRALHQIPYGETRSYRDIAVMIGSGKAVRAVGQANRRNPVPIIIPCHRVIGSSGSLTGYAGSKVDRKASLLQLEQVGTSVHA